MVRKLEMKLISDELSRQLSFAKRRNGLIKKALELAVLCGVDVIFIAFSPSGRLSYFSGDKRIEEVLSRFVELPDCVREFPLPAKEQLRGVINELRRQTEAHLRGDSDYSAIKHEIFWLTRDIAKVEAELSNYYSPKPEVIKSVEEAESYEAFLQKTLRTIRERMAELSQSNHKKPHGFSIANNAGEASTAAVRRSSQALGPNEVPASHEFAMPQIGLPALGAGSSRIPFQGPVPTTFTNLLLGASPEENGMCVPYPGACQAGGYVPHDSYNGPPLDFSAGSGAQQVLPSFYPTPVPSRGGSGGGLSPLMDPDWIEEDSIIHRILGQSSRGGFRSLLSNDEAVDALSPEPYGLLLQPSMQNPWGRGLDSQMAIARQFEVGESSSSQLKRKRQCETAADQMSPLHSLPWLSAPQGSPGGNSNPEVKPYNVYCPTSNGMNLPADPHVRFYMYYLESVKGKHV